MLHEMRMVALHHQDSPRTVFQKFFEEIGYQTLFVYKNSAIGLVSDQLKPQTDEFKR